MQAEFKTAQCRVRKNCIIAEGCDGTIFYATPSRARLLIDVRAAELVNVAPKEAPTIGPSEAPVAGPSEFKEPAEKKSSAIAQDGQQIGSASLSETGTGPLLSSSAAALVLPERSAPQSAKRGRGRPRKFA